MISSPTSYNSDNTHSTYPKKKGVSFFPEVVIHRITNLCEYSAQELNDTYFTIADLKRIKQSCKELASTLPSINSYDNDWTAIGTSLRGLEGRTKQALHQRRILKKTAREVVFDELDRQDQLGLYDPDELADRYYEVTEISRVSAQMIGIRDQNKAREEEEEEEEEDAQHYLQGKTTAITTTKTIPTTKPANNDKTVPKYKQQRPSMLITARSMKNLMSSMPYSSRKLQTWETHTMMKRISLQ